MTDLVISIVVFVFACGGLWLGRRLASALPKEHLSSEARGSAQIGIGMVGTLAALVLGLMITSAKSSFDVRRTEIMQAATSIILLDRALSGYGPEMRLARQEVGDIYRQIAQRVGAGGYVTSEEFNTPLKSIAGLTHLQESILAVKPANDAQRWFQTRALALTSELAQERVLTVERGDRSIPNTVLAIVIVWVFLIFVGIGVFAVSNFSVNTSLVFCALAFAGSIFVILELDTPYSGIIGISSEPLHNAGTVLGQ